MGTLFALGACAAPTASEREGRDSPEINDEGAPPGETTLVPEPSTPDPHCEGCEEVSLAKSLDTDALVEGDIVVDPSTMVNGIASSPTAVKLWPQGIVPYTIDASITKRERITEAVAHWKDLVGIRLVPRTNQADYIRFIKRDSCSSFVGRRGGRQDINLGDGCSTGSTIHEIGHALGLYHEQSRSDRDKYVTVNLANVDPALASNYRATTFKSIGEYDIGSLMHYGSYYFSSNQKPVMTTKDGKIIDANRASLSIKDVAGVRLLYAAEKLPAPSPNATPVAAVAETVLRPNPTALGKPLATIPSTTKIQRLGTTSGNYLLVAYDGKRGWVYSPFLDL